MHSFLSWELKTNQYQVSPITGSGSPPSDKKLTRITTDKGSWILMQWNLEKLSFLTDLVNKQRDFVSAQMYMPEIKAIDRKRGLVLFQDLGKLSLNDYVKTHGEESSLKYYKQAIDQMISLQQFRDWRIKSDRWPRVEKSLLFKEFLYTKEYLMHQLLGASYKESFLNKCFKEWHEICNLLDFYPHRPAHRDFHSQNLLIKDYIIYVIDFQSAGLFPRCYDLSSLIYDPYVNLSSDFIKKILEYLVERRACAKQALEEELWTTGVQRLFKASGSFASFYALREQTSHLTYIEPALKTLKTLLEQINLYPCFLELTNQLITQTRKWMKQKKLKKRN